MEELIACTSVWRVLWFVFLIRYISYSLSQNKLLNLNLSSLHSGNSSSSHSPGKTDFEINVKNRKEEWILVMFAKYIEIWPLKNTSVLSRLYCKIQKYIIILISSPLFPSSQKTLKTMDFFKDYKGQRKASHMKLRQSSGFLTLASLPLSSLAPLLLIRTGQAKFPMLLAS